MSFLTEFQFFLIRKYETNKGIPQTNMKKVITHCEKAFNSIADEFLGANPPVGIVDKVKVNASNQSSSDMYSRIVQIIVKIT